MPENAAAMPPQTALRDRSRRRVEVLPTAATRQSRMISPGIAQASVAAANPPEEEPRMETSPHSRRPGTAAALTAMVIGAVLGITGCGSGGGNGEGRPSAPASERSNNRSPQDEAEPTGSLS